MSAIEWTAFADLLGFITSVIGSAFGTLEGFKVFIMPDGFQVSALDLLVGFSALYLFVDFLASLDVVGSSNDSDDDPDMIYDGKTLKYRRQ